MGLREHKKLQTRAKLIEVAIDLADRQGFKQTTVDQIVTAASVSARTFAHYFPTKDSIVVALVHDLTAAVNAELALVPDSHSPFEALLAANLGMLDRAARGVGPMTIDRIRALLRMANSSTLQRMSLELRTKDMTVALGRRMRLPADDRQVALTIAVWTAVIACAWGDLGRDADPPGSDVLDVMRERLTSTFADLADVSSALSGVVEEPSQIARLGTADAV